MDQSKLDAVEGMIIAANLEVMAALDNGAEGDYLDDGLTFIRATLFMEAATLTRSVDQAEAAIQRFADKVASIQFCETCRQHQINGRCLDCMLEADLAELAKHNATVSAAANENGETLTA